MKLIKFTITYVCHIIYKTVIKTILKFLTADSLNPTQAYKTWNLTTKKRQIFNMILRKSYVIFSPNLTEEKQTYDLSEFNAIHVEISLNC